MTGIGSNPERGSCQQSVELWLQGREIFLPVGILVTAFVHS